MSNISRPARPFRIGCTSYIVPDDIVPNVRCAAARIDDIELVLFESPDLSNLPGPDTVDVLAALGKEHDLTYTVHFPIDRKAGSVDGRERAAFAEQAVGIVEAMAPLSPYAYLVHLEGVDPNASVGQRKSWARRAAEVCARIAEALPRNAAKVAVENLAYDPAWHAAIVEEYGFSHCIDIGHLWLYHHACWRPMVERYLPATRVVHLHGVRDGKDHIALSESNAEDLRELGGLLARYAFDGVLTLELFAEEDLVQSLAMVEETWEGLF